MQDKDYILLKTHAKLVLKGVKMPYKQHLVRAAYKVSKSLFSGQERLISFWEAILTNAPMAKGWR